MSATDPTYALGRTADEHQRLQQQAALFRPITDRFFRGAGLAPGMRVLDVGSGAGDVAFLAAAIVGPTGSVVGVDMDEGALATARARAQLLGLTNVTFLAGDVRTMALDGHFDAAIGRLVLLYLVNPAEGLAAIAARVRSGGLVAFHEMDMDPDVRLRSYPAAEEGAADALWNHTGRAIIQTFVCAGVHVRMGRMLLRTFEQAGLGGPALVEECSVGGGSLYAGYAYLANTLRSLAPLAGKFGVDLPPLDGLAERMRDEAVAGRLIVWTPPLVGASAVKP
ncbi:MAG: class I SAM-dependent methyltransferase [Acidobacteriota bacterium]